MKKLIPLTALVLGLTGGVALADRGHDHGHDRGGTTVVREHGRGNVVFRENNNYRINHGGSRVIVRNDNYHRPRGYGYGYGYRRPIYVSRPVIREHYYRRDYRPSLIVEDYGPRDGYYWVRGDWAWNGYEWIWQPGHYEPAW